MRRPPNTRPSMMFIMTPRESLESKITLPLAAHRQKTKQSTAMNRLARPRIDLQSIPYKWTKRFPDILADYQIGNVVLLGRFIVDDHQSGAAVFCH